MVSNIYPSHTSEYQRIVNKLLRCDESVTGKRVLIIQEGGLGDVLMFSRYLYALRDEGAAGIVLQAPAILAPVLATYHWVTLVENAGDAIDQSDCIICTFDLFVRYQKTPYFPSWGE
ncbi:hypothetical protein M3583_23775, partial [Bacillus subtilis]|nr:hypothetical protein [Bacillus subtilis]